MYKQGDGLYNKYFRKETITFSWCNPPFNELYNKYFRKETITSNVENSNG